MKSKKLFFLAISLTVIVINYSCQPTDKVYISISDYIESTKDEFSYEIEDITYNDNWTSFHVKMISGEWLDSKKVEQFEWWHYVDIIIPKEIKTSTGIMFIDGGESSEKFFRLDETVKDFSMKTGSIIVNISNIPFQPVNFLDTDQKEFYEDDLIAYSWNKFLTNGASNKNIEWLPRLPMTRAVVRAMDLAQEIAIQNSYDLETFMVSGASKRGWTAWMTAAVDQRVTSLVPMVIDLLNVVPSFENHYRSYGEFSLAVQEYVDYEIPDWMDSKEFQELLNFVEPFSFKEKFTMPKYLINAGSDEFFSTDSWRFYYNQLPGEKLLRYVPNQNHSLNGRYLNEDLISYFFRLTNNLELPKLKWDLKEGFLEAKIEYSGEYDVSLWTAKNEDGRDFRLWMKGELWKSSKVTRSKDNIYKIKIDDLDKGYQAVMLEFTIDPESDLPLIISTGPYVIPETYPFEKYESLNK